MTGGEVAESASLRLTLLLLEHPGLDHRISMFQVVLTPAAFHELMVYLKGRARLAGDLVVNEVKTLWGMPIVVDPAAAKPVEVRCGSISV